MASGGLSQEEVSLSPSQDAPTAGDITPHMGSPLDQHSANLMENVRVEKISFGREQDAIVETGKKLIKYLIRSYYLCASRGD